MHNINSILTWVAIAILFILLLTRSSGYVGRKMELTDMAEMAALSPELKKIYRQEIVSGILPYYLRQINNEWNSKTPADKKLLIEQFRMAGKQIPISTAMPVTGSKSNETMIDGRKQSDVPDGRKQSDVPDGRKQSDIPESTTSKYASFTPY